jgi:hypothetical protein
MVACHQLRKNRHKPTKTLEEGENFEEIEKLAQKTIACQSGINMNKVNACITESTVVIRLKLSLHENYSKY